jgi:hypothetical protein
MKGQRGFADHSHGNDVGTRMKKEASHWIYTLFGYALIFGMLLLSALALGLGAYWLVTHNVRPSHDSIVKWTGLAVFTIVTFAVIVQRSGHYWRRKVFWATVTSLLLVHTCGFWIILRHVEHWQMIWFLVIFTIEGPLILHLTNWLTNHFATGSGRGLK